MDFPVPFGELQTSISQALVSTTRSANRLIAEDLDFHRSLDRKVSEKLDAQNARLLDIAQRLLGSAASGAEVVGPTFPDGKDDLEHKWKSVVDVVDSLLERADTSLDEFTGVVKRVEDTQSALNNRSVKHKTQKTNSGSQFRLQELAKPQLLFENKPHYDISGPWKPLLTTKPNAKHSLEDSIIQTKSPFGVEVYKHPYREEIEDYSYPLSVYTKAEPIPYLPYEDTAAIWVDTPEALADMLEELKSAKEIAIDIEHHEHRSFSGLLSLMQISTRDKDWVIDTLKPWRRQLECLNEVFTDPSIVKVLHGAYMDIVWLQRDLGLYIVGLFDTHWAAKSLGYSGGSLAFLLQKFVGFEAQKQYATADWRIRPLPQELLDYARSDTHFLLYIYDNMRNELIARSSFDDPEKDKVQQVLERSKEVALQTYTLEEYKSHGKGPGGWISLLMRTPANLSREQFSVFRAVHQWRDKVARQEDEGLQFLMSNHALFNIAREMPSAQPQLLSLTAPVTAVLRSRADELLTVITKAKSEGENGPDMIGVLNEHRAKGTAALFAVAPVIREAPQSATLGSTSLTSSNGDGVRSTKSRFWGSFLSRLWPQRRGHTTLAPAQDVTLAVPLPPLTAEVFADRTGIIKTPKQNPELKFVRKEDRQAKGEDEEVFVIKELGQRKRKAEEERSIDDADALRDPVAPGTVDDGESASAKKERRKRTKLEKKAAKEEAKGKAESLNVNGGSLEGQDPAPEPQNYDYETSASVLHAAKQQIQMMEGKRGSKGMPGKSTSKAFDPFKKAMDAPKGMGRARKPEEGRSKTFKK